MESHEVMREVLKQVSAKQVASEMGLSLSLVYKWAEPPEGVTGSGANNPLDRVAQLVRLSKTALIPKWVAGQGCGFFIHNTTVTATGVPLIPVTNDIVQEFADMLATIAQAAGDNQISPEEARRIRQRWEELKSVTEGFVHAAEKGTYGKPKAAG